MYMLPCLSLKVGIQKNVILFSVCMELYGKSILLCTILWNMTSSRNVNSMFYEQFVPRYHSFYVLIYD